jgi:hypothetical protein
MYIVNFAKQIAKLEKVFKPLDNSQKDIYWDRLQHIGDDLFADAVDYLIDTHKMKWFPTVAEALEAVVNVSKERAGSLPEPTAKCERCDGTGYIMTDHPDSQPSGRSCDCELGEKIREGWNKHFGRRKK